MIAIALAALGASCRASHGGGETKDADEEGQDTTEGALVTAPAATKGKVAPALAAPKITASAKVLGIAAAASAGPAATIFFPGPKAAVGGIAAPPAGGAIDARAGDTVRIFYPPQRVRGCDGNGWTQQSTAAFFDVANNRLGALGSASGFSGVGMVPAAQPVLLIDVQVPPGAVRFTSSRATMATTTTPATEVTLATAARAATSLLTASPAPTTPPRAPRDGTCPRR